MSGITTGVGLMSGMDIQSIVEGLMSIERRPVNLLQSRLKEVQAQRTAYADLSARVLAIKSAIGSFRTSTVFRATLARSSNEDMIVAKATSGAAAAMHRIRVQQLATSQQMVSRGVTDPARSPLGQGTVVLASALSRLGQATSLDFLNGQRGVDSGIIRITDRSGASAQVDLSTAKTVKDVVSAINTTSGIQVQAEVRGDRLAIVDLSGQTASALTVADVDGGTVAADLGIAGTAAGGELLGGDINSLSEDTMLRLLNDGNGIGISGNTADMTLTAADGTSFDINLSDIVTTETNLKTLNGGLGVRLGTIRVTHSDKTIDEVDLSGANTIGDVITALGEQANLTVAMVSGKFTITDKADGDGKLIIEDLTGHAALDMGFRGESSGLDNDDPEAIKGKEIYQVRSLGDVLRAINYAAGNYDAATGTSKVTASVRADGKGVVLTDNTGGTGTLTVTSAMNSRAAEDLGLTGPASGGVITGGRLIATMNSTLLRSLNGGRGISEPGQVEITDRAGNTSTFDLSGAETVDDVLGILQAQSGGAQISAQLSESGLGIVIRDLSGGTGQMSVADAAGTTAADLNLVGQTTGEVLRGGPLYRQSISGNQLLSEMNYGKGIAAGSFKITDSMGNVQTFSVRAGADVRLRDVINLINSSTDRVEVEARINDSGDGIVIIDKASGPNALKIEDNGSTTAGDLRIAGEAKEGEDFVDGRISREITLDGGETLNDLASELNGARHLINAGVINDGSGVTPYRLMINAANTGTRGAIVIDSGSVDLGIETLVRAQDAVAYIGGDGRVGGIRVVSSDNQLDNVIPNVTVTLAGEAGGYADVTVSRDTDGLTKQMSGLAQKLSDALSRLRDMSSYDQESGTRGILLGDSTASQLRDSIYEIASISATVDGQRLSLSDLGFQVTSSGVEFDEDTFRSAWQARPEAIEKIFTAPKDGLYARLDRIMTRLTDRQYGLLTTRDQSLQDRHDLYSGRIDNMKVLLAGKEKRLYAQFQAMESALAQLQSQQAALGSLSSLAAQMRSSSGRA